MTLVRFLDFAGDAASQHFYCPSGPVEVDNGRRCGKITNSRKISQDSDGCHWISKGWVCKVHACSATDLLRDLGEVTCPVWVSASSLTARGNQTATETVGVSDVNILHVTQHHPSPGLGPLLL